MKRKIGELYNKPIVIGDKNEVTSNEIHINSLKSSNEGGGSSELEGEYYLARPNGWYWKPNMKMLERMTYDMPEYRAYYDFLTVWTQIGSVYKAVRYNGEESDYRNTLYWTTNHHNYMSGDSSINNPFIAIKESNIDNTFGKYDSLVDIMKTMSEIQGMPISEEESIALIEETFSITRITKEEYESLITA